MADRYFRMVCCIALLSVMFTCACHRGRHHNQENGGPVGGPAQPGTPQSAAPGAQPGAPQSAGSGAPPTSAAADVINSLPGVEKWREKNNPVVTRMKDKEAVAKVKEIYAQRCLSCHGEKGAGDGPQAASLKVRPSPLSGELKYGVAEWQVMRSIMEGIPNVDNHAFSSQLSENEGWMMVNAVEYLHRQH